MPVLDGPAMRHWCVRAMRYLLDGRLCLGGLSGGEARVSRATAPPPPRQQQAQQPRVTVAMDPSALLHQHGISLDQLSDPSCVVAQAAQAIIADFDNMMCASDDDVAS
ncbi:TPA: hypothetical protein ACH3X1_004575 [Trebouxia sp. C0004]